MMYQSSYNLQKRNDIKEMVIRKTNRTSLVEQVSSQIEQLIEEKHWKVGEKIPPELDLIEEFDVSRNTLREAIRALVYTGLLETRQGSGTIVKSTNTLNAAMNKRMKKANLLEILEVRSALEREAACLSAERRTDDDIKKIEALLEQCRETFFNGDQDAFIEVDIAFHKAIVEASHNSLLIDLYSYMADALHTSVSELIRIGTSPNSHDEVHDELVEAIKEKDVNAAFYHVNEYIKAFKKKLH